jgi:hypothetical protein
VGEDVSDLREVLARAMRAQGKVDPDEVFAKAEALDDPDPDWAAEDEQRPLPIDEERGYGWEP